MNHEDKFRETLERVIELEKENLEKLSKLYLENDPLYLTGKVAVNNLEQILESFNELFKWNPVEEKPDEKKQLQLKCIFKNDKSNEIYYLLGYIYSGEWIVIDLGFSDSDRIIILEWRYMGG